MRRGNLYTKNVTVPRRTAESIRTLEERLPRLTAYLKIPVVESSEQAVRIAKALIIKQLGTADAMGDAVVTETRSGWDISFSIRDGND